MSEMQWQTLPLSQLRPAAYNPRKALKPGDKEYQKIKNSIQEFGYVEPIIVNFDMTVIGGHQRLTVLKDLGYTEAQCVVLHIEDESKVKALNIALNKISGEWNEQLLADLLVDLQDAQFDLDLTGFEAPEVDQLFSKLHNKDIEEDKRSPTMTSTPSGVSYSGWASSGLSSRTSGKSCSATFPATARSSPASAAPRSSSRSLPTPPLRWRSRATGNWPRPWRTSC